MNGQMKKRNFHIFMSSAHVIADLEEFARSGRLGPLSIGLHRNQVSDLLGPPTDWLNKQPVDRSAIWKYGDLELYYDDVDCVYMIHFDWFEVPVGGAALQLSPWLLRRGLPLEDLENALHSADIQYSTTPDKWNSDCVRTVTTAGVSFVVQVKGEAFNLGLCEFGLSAANHSKTLQLPETKQ
jgi:hypothetical protein